MLLLEFGLQAPGEKAKREDGRKHRLNRTLNSQYTQGEHYKRQEEKPYQGVFVGESGRGEA